MPTKVVFVTSCVPALGGMYGAVLPDPIPNSEVKRARADDSTAHAVAKVGSCPFMIDLPKTGGLSYFRELLIFGPSDGALRSRIAVHYMKTPGLSPGAFCFYHDIIKSR